MRQRHQQDKFSLEKSTSSLPTIRSLNITTSLSKASCVLHAADVLFGWEVGHTEAPISTGRLSWNQCQKWAPVHPLAEPSRCIGSGFDTAAHTVVSTRGQEKTASTEEEERIIGVLPGSDVWFIRHNKDWVSSPSEEPLIHAILQQRQGARNSSVSCAARLLR